MFCTCRRYGYGLLCKCAWLHVSGTCYGMRSQVTVFQQSRDSLSCGAQAAVTAAEQLPKFLAGDPALGAAASGGAPWLHRPQSCVQLLVLPLVNPLRQATTWWSVQ